MAEEAEHQRLQHQQSRLISQEQDLQRQVHKLLRQQDELKRERLEVERQQQALEQRQQQRKHRALLIAGFCEFCQSTYRIVLDETMAHRHLEAAGWDLEHAKDSYMPPIPDSPVVGRTLQTSNFKAAYNCAVAPKGPMDLGIELGKLIEGHCQQEGIDWRAEGKPFVLRLQKEAMRNMDDPVEEMMQRMWTSALTLRENEFCSILNRAVRDDGSSLSDATAGLSRGINKLCVTAGSGVSAVHPPGNLCFRDGGFDDRYRSFFVKGRQLRQPAYTAASFSHEVATRFMRRVAANRPKVLWRVKIDPTRKCLHVNLVKKTNVAGEEEYLFAPYSAFTVLSAEWNAGTDSDPHVIELMAAVDNKTAPEDLPLAPWG